MEKIKVGVVGVGHIGREHARIYSLLPNIEFVGIYDVNTDAARRISQHHNVRSFSSFTDFMAAVDAATIATPTSTHYDVAKPLLIAGKHLLIEKPIADTPEPAKELVQLARARNVVLQVGHIERFNPVLDLLEKSLTHPRFIESHRLSEYPGRGTDVGVVLDLMIHDLEIVLHLVKSPIQSIDAVGIAVLSKGEDIANARLRFQNGCVANLTVSRISTEKLRKIRVFQEDTYLSLDYQKQTGEIYRKVDSQITREKVPIERKEPLLLELQSFVDCAQSRRTPLVSGEQGLAALDIAIEITEQIWKNPISKP